MPQPQFHVLLKVLQISQNRVEKLLNMLLRGDSTAFGVFIDAVAHNNQDCLTFDLLKQERDARAKEEKAAPAKEEQIGPTPTEGRRHDIVWSLRVLRLCHTSMISSSMIIRVWVKFFKYRKFCISGRTSN